MKRREVHTADKRVEDKLLTDSEIAAVAGELAQRLLEVQTGIRRGRPDLHAHIETLWHVAAATGGRIHELLAIKKDRRWTLLEDGRLVFWLQRGKGSCPGLITLAGDVARRLATSAAGAPAGGHVFTTSKGRPLSQQHLSKLLGCAVRSAGVDLEERQTWHALRHSAAWRVWLRTKDLRKVQAFLGHRDQATTSRYLQLDERARDQIIAEELASFTMPTVKKQG